MSAALASPRAISSPSRRSRDGQDGQPAAAACEACRKQKMRCIRTLTSSASPKSTRQGPDPCDRCRRNNRACYIPERKTQGRKPGSVGRYSGVEKAVRQLKSQVLKAARQPDSHRPQQQQRDNSTGSDVTGSVLQAASSTDRQVLEILMNFSASATGTEASTRPDQNASGIQDEACQNAERIQVEQSETLLDVHEDSHLGRTQPPQNVSGRLRRTSTHRMDDSVSNPLGLLADASGEAQDDGPVDPASSSAATDGGDATLDASSRVRALSDANTRACIPSNTSNNSDVAHGQLTGQSTAQSILNRPGYVSLGLNMDRSILESALDNLIRSPAGRAGRYASYFIPKEQKSAPDTGPDVDPIELGLVTMEEAENLFPMFFERLHPINGILDPMLHTPQFVRPRSALLFTWILAITAQFDHNSGVLAKRLRVHGEKLSKHVHSCGYKSVEIAQGYYISLLAAVPANTAAEDHSWIYTNYTLAMVSDLGLDHTASGMSSISLVDDDSLGSPNGNDPQQHALNTRLLRNRERTWYRILLFERAQSSAHGKITPFPDNELIRQAPQWWCHPLADPTDRYTCAFILLRQLLASLYYQVKDRFGRTDNQRHWVRDLVDSNLAPWKQIWLPQQTGDYNLADKMGQLFLRYVFTHGRLWTLSFALQDPLSNTSENNPDDSTKADCFEAAIACCEVTLRDLREIGEPMYCLMAPTWAMSSYAAVLALKLFPQLYGDRPGQQVELLALLAEVATQLEKAGTTPSHRFGVAALLGQHLLMVLKRQLRALNLAPIVERSDVSAPGELMAPEDVTASGYRSLLIDNDQMMLTQREDWGQQQDASHPYYIDPLMLTDVSTGGVVSLQDTFASMMRDWGGPPFAFEGIYYSS